MDCPQFCSDIVFEILSRTNLKTLDGCKTVCKEWYELAYESSFTAIHPERTNIFSGFLLQTLKDRKYVNKFVSFDKSAQKISLNFLPRSFWVETRIFASSKQGILCCFCEEDKKARFYICKPSTQQWRVIPSPKMRYCTELVGMVIIGCDPMRYRMVRLSEPRRSLLDTSTNHPCEIFNSGARKWKKINDVVLPCGVFICKDSSVAISDSIYWLLTNGAILCFNTKTENYILFQSPLFEKEVPYFSKQKLVEYKGKVALIFQDDNLMVWVLEDSRRFIWGLREVFSLEVVRQIDHLTSCIGFSNADTVVMAGVYKVIFYNFRNSKLWEIKSDWVNVKDSFMLRTDSVQIKL